MQPGTVLSEAPAPRRRPTWVNILGACIALVLLCACWLLAERYRARNALARYEKELLAKGEKLTFAELLSPMPEGENGFFEFMRLSKSLRAGTVVPVNSPPGMKLVAPGKAMVIAKEQSWSFGSGPAFGWEGVEADLKQNADTLVELRQVLRSPVLRSVIQYRGHRTPLPHLASAKNAAQWLSASSLHHLHAGNVSAAIDDIESILQVTRVTVDEPMLISQLVRAAVASIAMPVCWAVLQHEEVSDQELARLRRILTGVDVVTPMEQAIRGERVMGRDTMHLLRDAKSSFDIVDDWSLSMGEDGETSGVISKLPYDDEIRDTIRAAVVIPMWRFVWSYRDERHLMEECQKLIVATGEARAQRSAVPASAAGKVGKHEGWDYWLTDLFLSAVSSASVRGFRFQVQNEMAIAAIALKRYYLRHRKYPEKLDDLIPEFLEILPVDWMDGQRLRYHRTRDTFLLWSVGDNGVDDGGKPDEKEPYNFLLGPDMVWPQPASAAEVEAYKTNLRPKR